MQNSYVGEGCVQHARTPWSGFAFIIHTRTAFFAILQQSRYGQMSRMGRISPYIVHRVELTVERDVELFFRIGIQPDLNLPNKRDFGRQGLYPLLEASITFFLRSASISEAN